MLIIANNITSRNPEVAQAMKNLDAGYLKELAQRCLKAGADVLEINLQTICEKYNLSWESIIIFIIVV